VRPETSSSHPGKGYDPMTVVVIKPAGWTWHTATQGAG
jgi:hypothetical protein